MLKTLLADLLRRSKRPKLSVIICSIDDAKFERVASNYATFLAPINHELIRIDDAQSLAEGYNRGIGLSQGEFLVFSHDDIEILSSDFCERLIWHLSEFDIVGVAGTSRVIDGCWISAGQPSIHGQVVQPMNEDSGVALHIYGKDGVTCAGIQALDGLFIAARRRAAETVRFDAKFFDGFHVYDIDFTFRAYLANFRIAVCNDLLLYHQSLGTWDDKWRHYMQVFARKFAGRVSSDPRGAPHFWKIALPSKSAARDAYETRLQKISAKGAHI